MFPSNRVLVVDKKCNPNWPNSAVHQSNHFPVEDIMNNTIAANWSTCQNNLWLEDHSLCIRVPSNSPADRNNHWSVVCRTGTPAWSNSPDGQNNRFRLVYIWMPHHFDFKCTYVFSIPMTTTNMSWWRLQRPRIFSLLF